MICRILCFSAVASALLMAPIQAYSQEDKAETVKVFQSVVECQAIKEPTARLACYDANVPALAKAADNEEILVVSKEEVNANRRSIFGLKLPKIRLFGGGDGQDAKEEIQEINSTITSVSSGQNGYVFELEDGAVWYQTDKAFIRKPAAGMSIYIRRAALGSYMAKVNDGAAIRVKRSK